MSLDELNVEQRNALDQWHAVEEWRELVLKLLMAETKLFNKKHPDIELGWELTIDPIFRSASSQQQEQA